MYETRGTESDYNYGMTISVPPDCAEYMDEIMLPPTKLFKLGPEYGIRDASMRHDALARRRYVKPFKWFKFNRARKATVK